MADPNRTPTREELIQRIDELEIELQEARTQAECPAAPGEDPYCTIVEDMPSLICRFAPDGLITYVNPPYCAYFQMRPDELIGNEFRKLIPEEERDQVWANITSLTIESPTQQHEHMVVAPDGSQRWHRWTHQARFDFSGQVRNYQAIGYDITDVRMLEEQLRQSQKMEAIGRLAGGVAHDFNNILMAITNYAEMIYDDLPQQDPLRSDVDAIRHAANRATTLTQQLLAFGRKQIIQPQAVNLQRLIGRSKGMLQRLIGESIKLTVSAPPLRVFAWTDPGQVDQILLNLVVNSRDAMPDGGEIHIQLEETTVTEGACAKHGLPEPGRYVLLSVRDTGRGIDDATRARVFEPFFTTKQVGKGTGLGLSTVYGIVQQNSGAIVLESMLDEGTTFYIYLPVAAEAPKTTLTNRAASVVRTGTETVLLVEDDDSVRKVSERMLRASGYEVLSVADPRQAIEICRRPDQPLDLVLTDVVMPEMNGRECAEHLLQIRPDLQVLFMSGYTENAIAHHGVLDSVTEFIQKPFSTESLSRKVRDLLDR